MWKQKWIFDMEWSAYSQQDFTTCDLPPVDSRDRCMRMKNENEIISDIVSTVSHGKQLTICSLHTIIMNGQCHHSEQQLKMNNSLPVISTQANGQHHHSQYVTIGDNSLSVIS